MKTSALRFLACPRCQSDLSLTTAKRDGAEVLEGHLSCQPCGTDYPITRGVARFVSGHSYASSFGRQWNWFKTVQLDSLSGRNESANMLAASTGWAAHDYHGRLVLDAGVGAGRFAEVVARNGGEVVGVDLTDAIDAAFANIGRHRNVHLFQADIFAMPFRRESFDLAYSIGVLHHTHDTEGAFERVAAMVKPGGEFAVYLYDRYGIGHHASNIIRTITTRLPARLMFGLATVAIPLYYLHRMPVVGNAFQLMLPISMHEHWRWRWLDTFDWYTPRYQWKFLYPEVYRWFEANGFTDVAIFDGPIRMRGTKSCAHQSHTAV